MKLNSVLCDTFQGRIFIDGIYCGVDQYEIDNSDDDSDDDVYWKDISKYVSNKEIKNSEVIFTGVNDGFIILTLDFGLHKFELKCVYEEGCCSIKYT